MENKLTPGQGTQAGSWEGDGMAGGTRSNGSETLAIEMQAKAGKAAETTLAPDGASLRANVTRPARDFLTWVSPKSLPVGARLPATAPLAPGGTSRGVGLVAVGSEPSVRSEPSQALASWASAPYEVAKGSQGMPGSGQVTRSFDRLGVAATGSSRTLYASPIIAGMEKRSMLLLPQAPLIFADWIGIITTPPDAPVQTFTTLCQELKFTAEDCDACALAWDDEIRGYERSAADYAELFWNPPATAAGLAFQEQARDLKPTGSRTQGVTALGKKSPEPIRRAIARLESSFSQDVKAFLRHIYETMITSWSSMSIEAGVVRSRCLVEHKRAKYFAEGLRELRECCAQILEESRKGA